MISKRHGAANHVHPRRRVSLAVGDVLHDLKGHAYRVAAVDDSAEEDDPQGASLRIHPVSEEGTHESAGFTRRQRQIARLLASRATNAEIAAALGISVHTARHHSQKVLEKLGVTARAQVRARLAKRTPEQEG
jgi:DNA-binding CsgD family transcriptional regulator